MRAAAFLILVTVAAAAALAADESQPALECLQKEAEGDVSDKYRNTCDVPVKVWYCHPEPKGEGSSYCGDPDDEHMNEWQEYFTHSMTVDAGGVASVPHFDRDYHMAACTEYLNEGRLWAPKLQADAEGRFACYTRAEWRELNEE